MGMQTMEMLQCTLVGHLFLLKSVHGPSEHLHMAIMCKVSPIFTPEHVGTLCERVDGVAGSDTI